MEATFIVSINHSDLHTISKINFLIITFFVVKRRVSFVEDKH